MLRADRFPRSLLLVLAAWMLVAVTSPRAHAEPLTTEQVRSLLATMPGLDAISKKYEETDPLPALSDPADDPAVAAERMRNGMLSGALDALEEHAAWSELESLVKEKGFDSVAQWANVGDRVMAGFLQVQIEREAPEAQKQMAEVRQQVMDNPNFPEEQKQMMLQQIDQQIQMFEAMQSSRVLEEGDRAVIEPMMDEIRAAMERETDDE